MTTMQDRIKDILIEYERETEKGAGSDIDALTSAIMDEIGDTLNKVLERF